MCLFSCNHRLSCGTKRDTRLQIFLWFTRSSLGRDFKRKDEKEISREKTEWKTWVIGSWSEGEVLSLCLMRLLRSPSHSLSPSAVCAIWLNHYTLCIDFISPSHGIHNVFQAPSLTRILRVLLPSSSPDSSVGSLFFSPASLSILLVLLQSCKSTEFSRDYRLRISRCPLSKNSKEYQRVAHNVCPLFLFSGRKKEKRIRHTTCNTINLMRTTDLNE